MRQEVLDYIEGLDLGTFFLTQELPRSESGSPLYIKNLKRIYVDNTNYGVENFITTMDGVRIQSEVLTVRVLFASDAKTVPPIYEELVQNLRRVNDITAIAGVNRREVDVTTSLEDDRLVTEVEYRFYKLLT
jgi:hypothetical protein